MHTVALDVASIQRWEVMKYKYFAVHFSKVVTLENQLYYFF